MVAPGEPHHITQRGNRRQRTFFGDEDYEAYLGLMAHWCERRAVQVWAWCLMPNHVHPIAVPETEDGLRRHERTGRPLGSDEFVVELEERLGRRLRPRRPAPPTTRPPLLNTTRGPPYLTACPPRRGW